jgi:hypothetical protein
MFQSDESNDNKKQDGINELFEWLVAVGETTTTVCFVQLKTGLTIGLLPHSSSALSQAPNMHPCTTSSCCHASQDFIFFRPPQRFERPLHPRTGTVRCELRGCTLASCVRQTEYRHSSQSRVSSCAQSPRALCWYLRTQRTSHGSHQSTPLLEAC